MEGGEIEFVVGQKAKGMLETAQLDLSIKVHRQQLHALVDRFVARH